MNERLELFPTDNRASLDFANGAGGSLRLGGVFNGAGTLNFVDFDVSILMWPSMFSPA